ncbi:MAG: dicarboxylate/amino acid:cation symporter [Nitrospinaceae bacterium]
MKLKLHWQILTAMVAGTVFALIFGQASSFAEPLGTLFIRLLKMIIVPLVVFSMVTGVASAGNPKNLGRLGIKTFAYYILTSLAAILIGLTLVNLIQPGAAANLRMQAAPTPPAPPDTILPMLLRIVPENPVAAAAEGDMLGILFFSILFGLGLTQVTPTVQSRLLPVMESGFQVMMKITHLIIRLAPLGVFGLMVGLVNQNMGSGFFKAVGLYMVTIALGLSLHLFVVLPAVYYFFMRKNPVIQFGHMASALATVFATSSSVATLPVTLECVEQNAKVSNKIAGFVLPLGATVNMDGTALYECAGVLFIAQVLKIPLGIEQQLIVVITALLASIGTAAIPSAGLVMIFIVLDAVGLQSDMIPMIVGIMLAVDRPLDMYRGIVNIFSDSVGAVVIAQSENEIAPDPGGGG